MAVRSAQPLKKKRATDMILLECSETEPAECNEMKRYCGCISPAERRKRACEDEERNSAKKQRLISSGCFFSAVKCLRNGGKPN